MVSAAGPAAPEWGASEGVDAALPDGGAGMFTPAEAEAVLAAYRALARVGDATADLQRYGAGAGGWDPLIDRAHQALGVLMAVWRARPEAGGGV